MDLIEFKARDYPKFCLAVKRNDMSYSQSMIQMGYTSAQFIKDDEETGTGHHVMDSKDFLMFILKWG